MKNKKGIIITIVTILVVAVVAVILYFVLNDKNKLTVAERNWINNNISVVQNVNVYNGANVFGSYGEGVFYDFLEDFSKEYGLSINPITYTGNTPSGLSLGVKKEISDEDTVIYADHYVLVGKNDEVITDTTGLRGKTIGVLTDDLSYLSKYIKTSDITFNQYSSSEELIQSMDTNGYIIVPLNRYLDTILSNNYNITYHFSDVREYYVIESVDDTLSRVVTKYYNIWKSKFDEYYSKELFKVFTKNMNITDTEVDSMQSITYNYGFVNASPYEVISGGKYGGIVAVILSKFSSFANVDFNFIKYSNYSKFNKALNNNEVDIYFDYYNYSNNYYSTNGMVIDYSIIANKENNIVVNSIYSLIGETVYVEENSKLYDYVSSIDGITVKTFNTSNEFSRLNDKDVYIILDKNTFSYYQNSDLSNYSERYSSSISKEYTFKVRTNSALYKLLDKYVSYLNMDEVINEGLLNHSETIKNGGILTKIAEYILVILVIVVLVLLIYFRKSKKVSIAKKIKKEDKLKYIDQLTSLKNRNFLNENIERWNNNTIYPQTIIVVDLNHVQEINDIYGYNEGDKQIKALANILVKTQLDNSEIIRTDGNEFIIYLVGYNNKQVSNYIHKLTKEIKKLPYDHGAEVGFSMINDDIKTIEDAMNEAVEDMKKQKDRKNEEGKK